MRRVMMGMAALAALASAQPASADTVADWWEFANKIAPYMATSTSPEQGRAVTRASIAVFEGVNAIDRRYESYLDFPVGDPTASQDAAAATAAYTVMLHHFPTQKTALDDSYAIAMAGITDERAREAGRMIGEQAARAAIAAGGIDPALQAMPYRPRTTPGVWVATALPQIEPYMVTYRPWAIPSAEALRPPPPVALTSERWARD